MANGCNCPKSAAIGDVNPTTCPEDLGQLQRVALIRKGQLKFNTVTPANNLPATIAGDAPTEEAPYTVLKAAGDDTHLVFLPLFGGDPIMTPGDENTFGGNDNTTLNGAVYHEGFNPDTFTARFDQLTAAQTTQIREFKCEDLEVVFVNDEGKLIYMRDGDNLQGFPLASVATLAGRNVNGFGTRDGNVFKFQLFHNWDGKFEKVTPTDFNALTF
jgi:hypothetical protein